MKDGSVCRNIIMDVFMSVDKKWFLIKILNKIYANIYFVAFQ